jgi:hypothetical protein
MIGAAMVSPRRRQVLIAGLASAILPAVSFATGAMVEKLILSGRVLGRDGKPLAGARIAAAGIQASTDADGRFVVVTDTRVYGLTCNGLQTEGFISNQHRDLQGAWRATVALSLA